MFDKSFEEALKLADSSESREQGSGTSHASNRATKTSETILTNSPSVFILAIGWQSSQVHTSQNVSLPELLSLARSLFVSGICWIVFSVQPRHHLIVSRHSFSCSIDSTT